MKVKTVKISEDLRDEIQALQYETESRKDLLAFMVDRGCDLNGDAFRTYHREYQEFFIKYQAAKEELERLIAPQVEGKLSRWNLDFETLTVTCSYEV